MIEKPVLEKAKIACKRCSECKVLEKINFCKDVAYSNPAKPLSSFVRYLLATGWVELLKPFAVVPPQPPPSS
jgi:hypothetical protein